MTYHLTFGGNSMLEIILTSLAFMLAIIQVLIGIRCIYLDMKESSMKVKND